MPFKEFCLSQIKNMDSSIKKVLTNPQRHALQGHLLATRRNCLWKDLLVFTRNPDYKGTPNILVCKNLVNGLEQPQYVMNVMYKVEYTAVDFDVKPASSIDFSRLEEIAKILEKDGKVVYLYKMIDKSNKN